MKRLALALTVLLAACTTVKPGYVGIKVNNYGPNRGVQNYPILTGRVGYNPLTEDVYKFPIFMQTRTWTADAHEGAAHDQSITFNSSEGSVLNADISVSYTIAAEKVPHIFVRFRQDADHIADTYIRGQVRNTFGELASRMKVVDIFGTGKQTLIDSVRTILNARLGPEGFNFDVVAMIGAPRANEQVAASINAVITANQQALQAEQKIRQSRAEAEQAMAVATGQANSILTVANAQAQANRILAQSVTPELIRYQQVQRWDGVMPKVTGSSNPLISFTP